MWKLKDVKIVPAEISLINSVPVRILKILQIVDIVEDASIVGCMKLRTCLNLSLNSCLDEKE